MGADSVERDADGRMIIGALLTAPMYRPEITSSCTECKSTDLGRYKKRQNGRVFVTTVYVRRCLISDRFIPHLEVADAEAALDAGAEAVDKPRSSRMNILPRSGS